MTGQPGLTHIYLYEPRSKNGGASPVDGLVDRAGRDALLQALHKHLALFEDAYAHGLERRASGGPVLEEK